MALWFLIQKFHVGCSGYETRVNFAILSRSPNELKPGCPMKRSQNAGNNMGDTDIFNVF